MGKLASTDRQAAVGAVAVLSALIQERPGLVRAWTPEGRCRAVAVILKGIVDWISDEPTLPALIVEDVARMIERCEDGEELRDLSVRLREMMMGFEPDAGRVALTEVEARMLAEIERLEEGK